MPPIYGGISRWTSGVSIVSHSALYPDCWDNEHYGAHGKERKEEYQPTASTHTSSGGVRPCLYVECQRLILDSRLVQGCATGIKYLKKREN